MPIGKKLKTILDSSTIFATAFLVTDLVTIFSSFLIAYFIRNPLGIRGSVPLIDLKTYLIYISAITLTWVIVFWFAGLYRRDQISQGTGGLYKIIGSISFGMVFIILYFFFSENPPFSRLIIIYAFIISIIFVFWGRFLIKTIRLVFRKYGIDTKKLVIVGNDKIDLKTIQTLVEAKTKSGFELIGLISKKSNRKIIRANGFKFLGTPTKTKDILKRVKPDIVLLTATKKLSGILNLAELCRKLKIEFHFIPDIPRLIAHYSAITNINGIPIFGMHNATIFGWGRITKRAFDLIGSLLSLIILTPILLITAIAIKLTDFGPIIYKQERVGRDDKKFWAYKFRSMRPDADKFSHWTVRNDPRVTKIGKLIRKTSIDELPQLVNVLKGEMSIVGPRPEQPKFVEEFSRKIPRYAYRHRVKVGITGWAQVNGLRGDTSIEERAKYDLYYIENWTLLLDIKIILLTIKAILFKRGHTH